MKWSQLRAILPQELPFASIEDWEARLLQSSDWFFIAADPRSVGMLVAKAERSGIEADPALGEVRAGIAWLRPDVYAVDYSQLDVAPKPRAGDGRPGLAELARSSVAGFIHVDPDPASPIETYRLSISTDYGLNVELALGLRPGVDSKALAANLEARFGEATASPMFQLLRVKSLFDHAVFRADGGTVTISTSLSDIETRNLIQLVDITYDELRAAGTLEAWARGVGERAAATQVFSRPDPPPRSSLPGRGSRGGQARKLGSFAQNLRGSETARSEESNPLKKKSEDDRRKAEEQQQKYLEEQTEYYRNQNEELRRNQERREGDR